MEMTTMTATLDMRDPEQLDYFRVVQAKGAIKLYMSCGMNAARGMTISKWMAIARELTGKQFAARDYAGAVKALEQRRDTLLTYRQVDG